MRILLIVGICIISFLTILNYDIKYDTPVYAKYGDLLPSAKKQVDCLAENIYYEAGHEPYDGQVAVAMVTMHRVHSKGFENSVCGVVREKNSKVCQFSWWCEDKNRLKAIRKSYSSQEKKIYNKALEVAMYVYMNYGEIPDVTHGAKFYHADYVNPNWHNLKQTTKIGRHIFYKPKRESENNNVRKTEFSVKWSQEQRSGQLVHAFDGGYFSSFM